MTAASGEERARRSRARQVAYEMAETAAGLRSVDDLDEWLRDADEADVIDLVVAQARLSALLAKWVGRRFPTPLATGEVLRLLRVEYEVSAARGALDELDGEFPFDA